VCPRFVKEPDSGEFGYGHRTRAACGYGESR
jgi:hypothetical protein